MKRQIGKWLIQLGQKIMPSPENSIQERIERLKRFWFVADAPLFIDEPQLERLFDSIVRPEFELSARSRNSSTTDSRELTDELGASGEASLIPSFFKATATAKSTTKNAAVATNGTTVSEVAVRFADIKLERLIALYERFYPERLIWVDTDLTKITDMTGTQKTWDSLDLDLLQKPGLRPLVVLDLAPGTKLLPMAAELDDGSVAESWPRLSVQRAWIYKWKFCGV